MPASPLRRIQGSSMPFCTRIRSGRRLGGVDASTAPSASLVAQTHTGAPAAPCARWVCVCVCVCARVFVCVCVCVCVSFCMLAARGLRTAGSGDDWLGETNPMRSHSRPCAHLVWQLGDGLAAPQHGRRVRGQHAANRGPHAAPPADAGRARHGGRCLRLGGGGGGGGEGCSSRAGGLRGVGVTGAGAMGHGAPLGVIAGARTAVVTARCATQDPRVWRRALRRCMAAHRV